MYWIHLQNIHAFTYQKKLLHTLLLLVFKIVKSLKCILIVVECSHSVLNVWISFTFPSRPNRKSHFERLCGVAVIIPLSCKQTFFRRALYTFSLTCSFFIPSISGLFPSPWPTSRLQHRYFPVIFGKFLRTPFWRTSANDCFFYCFGGFTFLWISYNNITVEIGGSQRKGFGCSIIN